MSLRNRLLAVDETIQEVEAAAEQMYQEGKFLARHKQHHNAAIYLLEYAAEMWLETAHFWLKGALLTDLVPPRLAPARTAGSQLVPPIDAERYHSLILWARLIEAERRAQNKQFNPPSLALDFQTRVNRLYLNWWVEMRYRQALATVSEAEVFLKDVQWLHDIHTRLWR